MYIGSPQIANPKVGIHALSPKTVKTADRAMGLMKLSLTVINMQTKVKIVMIDVKMYLQIMNGPHAYLNEMNGYVVPKIRTAIPQ